MTVQGVKCYHSVNCGETIEPPTRIEETMFTLLVGLAAGAAGMYWYEHKDDKKD